MVVSHKCFTSTTFFELALEDSHTPLNTNWLASFQTFPPSSFRGEGLGTRLHINKFDYHLNPKNYESGIPHVASLSTFDHSKD